eukprot:Transcript_9207.p1 GENE.Transcript_9207~~Transcript_9207.p1  ORF type:complete len:334 (-),score=59.35 Transcript_9207:502-1449(-)
MFFLKAACCPCFGALEDESVTVDVATSPVNLNSASQSELEALPGIGSARAAAIVQYRLEHGHFTALDSLLQVPGIGPATVGKLHGLACCSSGPPRPPPRPPAPPRPSGPAAGEGSHEAFFFPDRSAENGVTALLRALEDARASLDVAVYAISHAPLANALLAAHERGVRVRVLTDDEQAKDGKSQCSALRRAGVPVRCDRSARLHMHHKFAVVDGGPLLAHGSFNWRRAAPRHPHHILSQPIFAISTAPYHPPPAAARRRATTRTSCSRAARHSRAASAASSSGCGAPLGPKARARRAASGAPRRRRRSGRSAAT